MAGFRWAGSLDGSDPIIMEFPVVDTVVLSRGEMVNLESGEVDAAASGDTGLLGIALADVDNTNDGETVKVIVNPWAIYEVEDANVRTAGSTLDLASGGMGLTTSSNVDFKVVANSAADEPTRVMIHTAHAFKGA